MEEKLIKIEVNIQQSLIWTGSEGVSNAICAITHKRRQLVVIRPEYVSLRDEILALVGFDKPAVLFADSFEIDTWDDRVEDHLKRCVRLEEAKNVIGSHVDDLTDEQVEEIATVICDRLDKKE